MLWLCPLFKKEKVCPKSHKQPLIQKPIEPKKKKKEEDDTQLMNYFKGYIYYTQTVHTTQKTIEKLQIPTLKLWL